MYTKIHDRIWSMLKRRGVSGDARLLYIYLFSCSHRTLLGLYQLPLSYAAEDLEFSLSAVKKLMRELEEKEMVEYDAPNSCVFVKKFLECNEIPNKNVEKKAAKIAACALPGTDLLRTYLLEVAQYKEKLPLLFETVLKRYCERFHESYEEQYAKWYGNTEAESRIQKQNTEAEAESRKGPPPAAGDAAAAAEREKIRINYRRQVSPKLTEKQEAELDRFCGALSGVVVQLALDKAEAASSSAWSYVETVLRDYEAKGIDTAEMAKAEDDRFRSRKQTASSPEETRESLKRELGWMDRFLDEHEGS